MRVGILSDIHGNDVALQAALAALEAARVDQLICLGDVPTLGPQPQEVVDRLRTLGCPVVMGNSDAWVFDPHPPERMDDDARRIYDIENWCAQRLDTEALAYLSTFQPTVRVPLADGVALLGYHGTPRSNVEHIRLTTSDEELRAMLAGHAAQIWVGGHSHRAMLRCLDEGMVVVVGSVGLPLAQDAQTGTPYNPAWAEYAIVDAQGGGIAISFHRAWYDPTPLFRAARERSMPHAEWYIRDWRLMDFPQDNPG